MNIKKIFSPNEAKEIESVWISHDQDVDNGWKYMQNKEGFMNIIHTILRPYYARIGWTFMDMCAHIRELEKQFNIQQAM